MEAFTSPSTKGARDGMVPRGPGGAEAVGKVRSDGRWSCNIIQPGPHSQWTPLVCSPPSLTSTRTRRQDSQVRRSAEVGLRRGARNGWGGTGGTWRTSSSPVRGIPPIAGAQHPQSCPRSIAIAGASSLKLPPGCRHKAGALSKS